MSSRAEDRRFSPAGTCFSQFMCKITFGNSTQNTMMRVKSPIGTKPVWKLPPQPSHSERRTVVIIKTYIGWDEMKPVWTSIQSPPTLQTHACCLVRFSIAASHRQMALAVLYFAIKDVEVLFIKVNFVFTYTVNLYIKLIKSIYEMAVVFLLYIYFLLPYVSPMTTYSIHIHARRFQVQLSRIFIFLDL